MESPPANWSKITVDASQLKKAMARFDEKSKAEHAETTESVSTGFPLYASRPAEAKEFR